MKKVTVRVTNPHGIHCRPSGVIYKAIEHYSGTIILKAKGEEVVLNSLMDIISLGIFYNDEVEIEVSGNEEAETCSLLAELFSKKYDFPKKTSTIQKLSL